MAKSLPQLRDSDIWRDQEIGPDRFSHWYPRWVPGQTVAYCGHIRQRPLHPPGPTREECVVCAEMRLSR